MLVPFRLLGCPFSTPQPFSLGFLSYSIVFIIPVIFVIITFIALQYIQNCKWESIAYILLQLIFHSTSEIRLY